MANEISTNINVTVTINGQIVTGNVSGPSDASNPGFIGNEQLIGTTAETIFLGDIGATPQFLFVRNMDGTNFVTVDAVSALTSFPQKILPNKGIYLTPETGTIYAKADTAACKIWVVAA